MVKTIISGLSYASRHNRVALSILSTTFYDLQKAKIWSLEKPHFGASRSRIQRRLREQVRAVTGIFFSNIMFKRAGSWFKYRRAIFMKFIRIGFPLLRVKWRVQINL